MSHMQTTVQHLASKVMGHLTWKELRQRGRLLTRVKVPLADPQGLFGA